MMAAYALISILQVFEHICSFNKRVKSNIPGKKRKKHKAATLHVINTSTRSLCSGVAVHPAQLYLTEVKRLLLDLIRKLISRSPNSNYPASEM